MADVGTLLDELQIDVLVAGFPKCGTTSFAEWLDSDPNVALSRPKETFLLTPGFGRTAILPSEGVFGHAQPSQRRIEATSLGLYSPYLMDALRQRPHVKVIALYREPWKTARSWHQQMVNARLSRSADLEASINTAPLAPEESATFLQNYRGVLGYGTTLEKWEQTLAPGQLLALHTDELARLEDAGSVTLAHLHGFAGLRPAGAVPVSNSFHERRFPGLYATIRNSPILQPLIRRVRYGNTANGLVERAARGSFLEAAEKPDHAPEWVDIFADEYDRAELVRQRNRDAHGRSVT